MFSRIALLFAPSLLAASAAAQNAVGLWRSDDPDGQNLGIGQNIPDGTVGVRGWTVLPPDVTMYFKPQAQGAARELDFRGIEFRMFLNVMNSAGVQEVPKVEIRRAIQAAIPNQARYVPDYVTPPYAVFPAQAWVGTGNRVFRYVLPESVPVPSGSSAGTGLCAVFVDYCKFGASPVSSGEKALLMVTDNESGSGSNGFSGFTSATGNNTFVGSTNEFTVNFLFDQSMMQPAKNVTLVQPGADLLDDKGPYPPNVTALLMDDGRGALRMNASNVISFMVNSDKSLHGSSASTWIVPLIMLENDIAAAGTTNPTPENWVGNSNAPDLAYVHPMPMQKFLDDLATSAGSPPNSGVGAALNPRNTTLPIWLGVDLPSFQNLTILARSLTYADISSGV
ncbi:MAG TPA: hypothetical protein VKE69_06645, partial [Planctomycetota bacterium]|nr:hypothetical protein [Planctomycetota bacterium]